MVPSTGPRCRAARYRHGWRGRAGTHGEQGRDTLPCGHGPGWGTQRKEDRLPDLNDTLELDPGCDPRTRPRHRRRPRRNRRNRRRRNPRPPSSSAEVETDPRREARRGHQRPPTPRHHRCREDQQRRRGRGSREPGPSQRPHPRGTREDPGLRHRRRSRGACIDVKALCRDLFDWDDPVHSRATKTVVKAVAGALLARDAAGHSCYNQAVEMLSLSAETRVAARGPRLLRAAGSSGPTTSRTTTTQRRLPTQSSAPNAWTSPRPWRTTRSPTSPTSHGSDCPRGCEHGLACRARSCRDQRADLPM